MGYPDEEHCSIRSTGVLRLSSYAAAFLLLLSMSACGNSQPSFLPSSSTCHGPCGCPAERHLCFWCIGLHKLYRVRRTVHGRWTGQHYGRLSQATLRPALSRQIQS